MTVRKPRAPSPPPLLALAALGLAACAGEPSATITLTTGEELDAFSRAPAPTSLVVESIGLDGAAKELARTSLPRDELSLGSLPRTDAAALRVTAADASGATVLRGESLYFQWGALEDAAFEVFVQRTRELARYPRSPAALEAPLASVALARYVLMASGTSAFLYDLLMLRTLGTSPTLPRPARSLATYGSAALVVDEAGASVIDLTTSRSEELAAPTGGTFAEVAGGATVISLDGASYVVGGTRPAGGATARVLVVAADGKATFATLATAREGACATFVEGRGLVVYGGDATGASAEVLAAGATQGSPLPYPADAAKGCGAAALDPTHVLVAGGTPGPANAKVIDLACGKDCAPVLWKGSVDLTRVTAAALGPGAALVVGDAPGGETRALRLTPEGASEVPLKAPRRGGRLLALPVKGHVAVLGGAAAIERYLE